VWPPTDHTSVVTQRALEGKLTEMCVRGNWAAKVEETTQYPGDWRALWRHSDHLNNSRSSWAWHWAGLHHLFQRQESL